MPRGIPVVVLASGGIDSAALIHRYLAAKDAVTAMHFQYGQRSGRSELQAFRATSKHYGVNGKTIRLGFNLYRRGNELLGRNGLFSIIAASVGPPPTRIALGINKGNNYYDCSKAFVADCQKLLDGYFGGTVVLEAPFVEVSKGAIMAYCKRHRVPLQLTYSCQVRNSPPCGKCPSCLDRQRFLGTD